MNLYIFAESYLNQACETHEQCFNVTAHSYCSQNNVCDCEQEYAPVDGKCLTKGDYFPYINIIFLSSLMFFIYIMYFQSTCKTKP